MKPTNQNSKSKMSQNSETPDEEKRKHNAAHKIQTKFIQYIHQKWQKSTQNQHRNQCINEADFLTFQPIQEIPSHALFCIQDQTKWFAFHIDSFAEYIHPLHKDNILNPYTRNPFHHYDIHRFYLAVKLKLLVYQTCIQKHDPMFSKYPYNQQNRINPECKSISLLYHCPYLQSTYYPLPFDKRIDQIIQNLNFLENEYLQGSIQSKWLTELSESKWYQFYVTILFLWKNRLTPDIRENVNPRFPYFPKKTKTPVKDSLALCENLLNYGINENYCQIGASIVLASMAMVNVEAKYKMPYYYDAL